MDVTWAFAWSVAGIGFGVVMLVLAILAIAIFVAGLIIKLVEKKAGSNNSNNGKS